MGRHRWLKKERNRNAAAEEAARPRREQHLREYFDDMMGWMNVLQEEIKAGKIKDAPGISHEFGNLVFLTKQAKGLATLTEAAKAVQAAGHDYARTFGILDVDVPAIVSKSNNPMAPFWDEMVERNAMSYMDTVITNTEESTVCFDNTTVDPEALKETLTALASQASKLREGL